MLVEFKQKIWGCTRHVWRVAWRKLCKDRPGSRMGCKCNSEGDGRLFVTRDGAEALGWDESEPIRDVLQKPWWIPQPSMSQEGAAC